MNEKIQILSTESPVDEYIQKLIEDVQNFSPKNEWVKITPQNTTEYSQYELRDADKNIATLRCDFITPTCYQHTLKVVDEDGYPVMHSVEWRKSGTTSELAVLYDILESRLTKSDVPAPVDPETTDRFIEALVRDARMTHPILRWRKETVFSRERYHAFMPGGKSCFVTLQKNYETEEHDSYTMKYTKNGQIIMLCTEFAKLDDDESMLRELYCHVAKEDVCADDTVMAIPEVHKFIADTKMRKKKFN